MYISMQTYTCSEYIKTWDLFRHQLHDSIHIEDGKEPMLALLCYNFMFLKFKKKDTKQILKNFNIFNISLANT